MFGARGEISHLGRCISCHQAETPGGQAESMLVWVFVLFVCFDQLAQLIVAMFDLFSCFVGFGHLLVALAVFSVVVVSSRSCAGDIPNRTYLTT